MRGTEDFYPLFRIQCLYIDPGRKDNHGKLPLGLVDSQALKDKAKLKFHCHAFALSGKSVCWKYVTSSLNESEPPSSIEITST